MKKILDILYSTRLMAVLFIVFGTAMGIATFIENDYGTQTARALVYNTWWFEGIMLFFVINFFGNIFRYQLYKKEKWVVLSFHLAFLFIIIGAAITRYISYEGIMPIQEGETTNVFFSEATYLNVTIDDGKVQKVPIYEKLLLSSLGENKYALNTDFKGQEINLKLSGYIPNVYTKFEESENGEEYLHFVESGGGGRHDHYIKKGTIENVHGVLVGFENGSQSTINFKQVDGVLKMISRQAGSFLRMADQFQGTVAKDSLQDFNLLSLHSIAGLKFVVPKPPLKGTMKLKSGNKEEHPKDLLTFDLTSNNKTKRFEIKGGQYNTDGPIQFKFEGLNYRIKYGAKIMELPFHIKLRDFQLEKYPGSESAMSYASEVTVIDPSETFDFRIFMNNILNYKGYRFFQSSYDLSGKYEETRLSVNHDYWGTLITYLGYFILFGGLILTIFTKNTRFSHLRETLKKVRIKKNMLTTLALLFITSLTFSQHQHTGARITDAQIDSILQANAVDKIHAEKFSKIVVQDAGGRMKPIHTFSSQLLRKVSKNDTYKGLDANQVFLSIVENPRFWFEVPIIYLERGNNKIRTILGIDVNSKYASLANFIDEKGNYKIREITEKAQKKNIKSKFEKDLINIDKRVGLLYSAIGGGILRIFPIPNDENNKWVSQPELNEAGFSGVDSVFVKQILPVYIQTLQTAKSTNDYTETDKILGGIQNFQKKFGAAVYPDENKVQFEVAYNKYDVFKKLFKYYMYIGTLMFLFVIFQIFKDNKTIRFLIKGCIALIVIFFAMHTLGLAARWYVSGHAPWSNAYESMIYVAWATMLFGLIFGRRSSLTIAATAFLTSMILMIAHWNWMDPEIANLQPVLNSYWLMIHVAIIVASYGPFALGMIIGLISLLLIILTNNKNKEKLKLTISELTIINEMALTVGLILLTVGNFLGGMWANESWGRYWGWDPKETWALISIMVYAFVLHLRLVPKLQSRYTFNLWSVIAFASIIMTYFGVNFYLSGLHAYASGDKVVTPSFVYYSVGTVAVLGFLAHRKHKKYYKK